MRDTTVHFVAAVKRHVEVSYDERREELRGGPETMQARPDLRALGADGIEENDAQHRLRVAVQQMRFTRLTWPLRDLNVYTRISLPRVDSGAHGFESVSFPGNLSFAHGEMHPDEKQMFDWLEAVQTRQNKRRLGALEALETGTPAPTLPSIPIPDHMHGRALAAKQAAMAEQLPAADRAPAYSGQVALQAWRWKSLLLQSTLLCALNGICEELLQDNGQARIDTYVKVGLERSMHRLILSNFNLQPPRFRAHTLVVCARVFDRPTTNSEFPATSPREDDGPVELLRCRFGLKQKGARANSKLARRIDAEAGCEYLVKKSGIESYTLPAADISPVFTTGVRVDSPAVNTDWYVF